MTFTEVSFSNSEDLSSSSTSVHSLATHTAGNIVLLSLVVGGAIATGVTGGGCTWVKLSSDVTFSVASGLAGGGGNVWLGTVTSPGTSNATVTLNQAMTNGCRFDANEFSATGGAGSVTLVDQGHVDSGSTATWPTLTPTGPNQLYWGYCEVTGGASAGTTPGFTYQVDTNGNACGYCATVSSAYTPAWADADQNAGVMVLVTDAAPAVTAQMPPQVPAYYQQRIR